MSVGVHKTGKKEFVSNQMFLAWYPSVGSFMQMHDAKSVNLKFKLNIWNMKVSDWLTFDTNWSSGSGSLLV